MTPFAALTSPVLDASRPPASPAARTSRTLARGRSTLLALARRNGEVRLRVGDGAPAGAADLSQLLDELNEQGLLRYGGLHAAASGRELVYLPA